MPLKVDPSLLASLDPAPARLALRIDALFYRSAIFSLSSLDEKTAIIEEAVERFESLLKRRLSILDESGGDEHAAYDALEPIYIQLEGADHQLVDAYAPYIRELASVHFNAHAALETFVNWSAQNIIKGKQFDAFDKLHLFGKCMFLPSLKSLKPLDAGSDPMQSVQRLIRRRNQLMHYKPRVEVWNGASIPSFLKELGLSQEDAEASICAARTYIEHVCGKMGLETPGWLEYELHGHFDVMFDIPE